MWHAGRARLEAAHPSPTAERRASAEKAPTNRKDAVVATCRSSQSCVVNFQIAAFRSPGRLPRRPRRRTRRGCCCGTPPFRRCGWGWPQTWIAPRRNPPSSHWLPPSLCDQESRVCQMAVFVLSGGMVLKRSHKGWQDAASTADIFEVALQPVWPATGACMHSNGMSQGWTE